MRGVSFWVPTMRLHSSVRCGLHLGSARQQPNPAVLAKAEDASKVTLTAYNLGGATLIEYLDAQRTYRDAVRIYNQALFYQRISLYELASAIGSGVE